MLAMTLDASGEVSSSTTLHYSKIMCEEVEFQAALSISHIIRRRVVSFNEIGLQYSGV